MRVTFLFTCALFFCCLASCASVHKKEDKRGAVQGEAGTQIQPVVIAEELPLVDDSRKRAVPVMLYSAASERMRSPVKRKLAIINHGYEGKNTAYTFLANYLVTQGYTVASIQHELPGDAPLPLTGNIYQNRLPHWQRGVQNIQFVLEALPRRMPEIDASQLLLVGHSNGGDMVMLFTQLYPEQVQHVISLDNRRVALPRRSRSKILTLRSSDQPADEGVLPTFEEQQKYGITVIKLPHTLHNDMWDGATALQKQEIIQHISVFLQKR